MSSKKGGLGRGLDALFTDNSLQSEENSSKLRISEIEPNKNQPRKEFDEDALSALADSIAAHGVLQPLVVRPLSNGKYQLVAGERRWRASRIAGLTEVPVVIKELTEQEASEIALIENLQREDLNVIEEAEGYKELIEKFNLTQEEVAQVVGKSRSAVTNTLRILTLPESILDFVRNNTLSYGHARCLIPLEDEEKMKEVVNLIISKELSVRQTEKIVKALVEVKNNGEEERKPEKTAKDVFYTEVELALTREMGRKIKVTGNKNKGTIEIEFYSKEDLKTIANKLGVE